MKVDLRGLEGTLLAPLWGRAKFSRDYPSVFNDAKAIDVVEQIDYDFSAIDEGLRFEGTLMIVARASSSTTKSALTLRNTTQHRSLISERALTLRFSASITALLSGTILTSPTSSASAGNCFPNLTAQPTLQNRCSTRVGARMSSTQKTVYS